MEKQSSESTNFSEIMNCLRSHLNQQRPVTLHNTYRGVPVNTEAEVAMVHRDFVGLIVHPYQAVCIKEARYTYVESKTLPEWIKAFPVSIDFINNVVLLKQLKLAQSISIDLLHSWVAPEKPLGVDIQTKKEGLSTATILEIAAIGENHIRVVLSVPEESLFTRGDKVSLAFQLTPEGDTLSVQGKVQSLIKIRNQDAKRLEVDGRAVMTDEVTILTYIAQREDQIMKALDKAYKKLRKGKKV